MGNNKQNVIKANFIQICFYNILKQIHAASFFKTVSSQAGDGRTYSLPLEAKQQPL